MTMLTMKILAGLILLSRQPEALHFPGLVSKDYTYDKTLPIKQGYYLTSKGKSNII